MDLLSLFQNTDNVQEFEPGTTILAEGTPGNVMYSILQGEVEARVGEQLIEVMGPGDILGEMALIDAQARSATVVAKSACRLALVNEKRFLFMVQETPYFALHVMRVLAERLRRRTAERGA